MVSIQNPADLTAPSKEFTFDSAYDAKSSSESIYNDICYPLVEVCSALNFHLALMLGQFFMKIAQFG